MVDVGGDEHQVIGVLRGASYAGQIELNAATGIEPTLLRGEVRSLNRLIGRLEAGLSVIQDVATRACKSCAEPIHKCFLCREDAERWVATEREDAPTLHLCSTHAAPFDVAEAAHRDFPVALHTGGQWIPEVAHYMHNTDCPDAED